MTQFVIDASLLHAQVKIVTFGVKYNEAAPACDCHFDCQRLDNPPGQLWTFNGTSKPIQQDVMRQISTNQKHFRWFQNILSLSVGWANYAVRTSTTATIAFNCYGGRHRSVATAELVNRFLVNKGFVTKVEHLDVLRSNAYLKGHRT